MRDVEKGKEKKGVGRWSHLSLFELEQKSTPTKVGADFKTKGSGSLEGYVYWMIRVSTAVVKIPGYFWFDFLFPETMHEG